jgi:hypothetical protein
MNFSEIEHAVRHLISTCKCESCDDKYKKNDVHIIATTKVEALFELKCKKCKTTTIVSVIQEPVANTASTKNMKIKEPIMDREHRVISRDDVLDTKNFLKNFDGNFKKIFINTK